MIFIVLQRSVFLFICTVLVIPFFFLNCTGSTEEERIQKVEIELSEIFSIGEKTEDTNYLFSSIASVSVDEYGRIYVVENFGDHIKLFDDNGQFIKHIGREGSGPGEFRMILSMTRDTSGNLFVMDQSSGSISKFDLSGNYIDQYSMPNPQIRQIESISDDNFFAAYLDSDTDLVVHSYDSEFNQLTSQVHRDDFIQTDERFEEVITRFLPGRFLVYDESTIYFTPVFYHGIIHQYKKNNGHWNLTTSLDGYTVKQAFDPTDPETEGAYVLNLGNEILAAIINNESRGLFKTNDDHIIHFTSIRADKMRVFGAEVYSDKGEYLGYTPIKEEGEGNIYALQIDSNNYLYITEQIDETVLIKYRIDITEIGDG